ncbi:ABC transporter permease [Mesoplasma syrphidae]|uniref:ABC transporter permease n=1 Tax=Mesoplasma syrphidae TaxID=225999 RepID=A0A2K9BRS8_9MOLU|nr:ABC transporter permease [Mesoplasma syrphidae]AUF83712.1 ABC transporter permease [Mesoplasma syrphidae]
MVSNINTEVEEILDEPELTNITRISSAALNKKTRKQEKEKGKNVSFYNLLVYFLKLIFIDKAFLIIFGIGFVFAIVFGIMAKVQSSPIVVFNWYYLINTVLLLILVSRLVTYFLHNKFEDQTMTIIIQQKTKRITILISIWVAIFLGILALNILSTVSMVLLNTGNSYGIRYLFTNLAYQTACSIFFISFLFFLTLFCKQQIVSIILSFVLLSLFISSLPQQFFATKMNDTQITFVDRSGSSFMYKGSEINNALIFNENVNKGHIKFPHLSKYINDYYISKSYTIANYEGREELNSRMVMWSDLGIINTKEEPLLVNGSTTTKLKIDTITSRSGVTDFSKGDVVDIKLSFKNKFKNIESIKDVYETTDDAEHKAVLSDLIDFFNYYESTFKSVYPAISNEQEMLEKMWSSNYNNYGKYLSLQINSAVSTMSKPGKEVEPETNKNIEANITNAFFQSYIFNNYFATESSKNYDLSFSTNRNEPEYANNYKALMNAFSEQMYFELFIRILEDNFINQTSNYVIITESEVLRNENFNDYERYMKNYQLLNLVLFPANMNSYFNHYAGKEWDQYWFNFGSKSSINFESQDNIFFTNVKFKVVVNDENNKISGTQRPNIQLYLAIQVAFLLLTAAISVYLFIRKDLK